MGCRGCGVSAAGDPEHCPSSQAVRSSLAWSGRQQGVVRFHSELASQVGIVIHVKVTQQTRLLGSRPP